MKLRKSQERINGERREERDTGGDYEEKRGEGRKKGMKKRGEREDDKEQSKRGIQYSRWPVGTQTQYLWMFISPLLLREAHIFHLGIAGQQARRSSASKRAGRVTETLTCMRENVAEAWVLISFCL